MHRLWIAFAPYAIASIVHVGALAADLGELAAATKLTLMPLLALAVVWRSWGSAWTSAHTLLVVAIGLSWLGDGARTFFPFAPELPAMLLCFGLAHLCYIVLFWRRLAVRRVPLWAAAYAVWWVVLVAVLWPQLGGLALAVAAYGIVLGGTAVAASRCNPLIAWGGAFFLTSDSVLAFRLFMPDAMPGWTSPLVMLTYCLGQGLIAAGVLVAVGARRSEAQETVTP